MQRRRLPTPVLMILASVTFSMGIPGCGCEDVETEVVSDTAASQPTPVPAASGPRDVAVLQMKDGSEIRIELLPELAPNTVENFARLVEEGFYDGTTFHRVIPGFMIQGGDPASRDRDPRNDGKGRPGFHIEDEISSVSHVRGIVSLANRGQRGTGTSQFFIVVDDHRELDGRYTIFGHVVGGMDVADTIANTPRDIYGRHGPENRPMEDQVIAGISIESGTGGTAAPRAEVPPPASDFQAAESDEGDDS